MDATAGPVVKSGHPQMYSFCNRFFHRDPVRRTRLFALLLFVFLFGFQLIAAQTGEDDGEDAVALFNQAQELHEKGDLAAAIELYKKALKVVPEFPEAEYQCGTAYMALGRFADAETSYRRAVELRPDWTLALTGLGSVLIETGKLAEAEKVLTKSIEIDDQSFPALAALAELRLKNKAPAPEIEALLAKITAMTAKAKPTAALWAARAALESRLGRRDAARSSLTNALSLDPRNKYALSESVEIALGEGDIVRASEAVTKLEKLTADTEAIKLFRARILAADGDAAGALKILDTIKAESPGARILRDQLRMRSSENAADLEKQLETEPKNPTLLGRLCSLYRVGDPRKALEYCRRASEAEPANLQHAVGFGAALVQAKLYSEAIGLFRKLVTAAPDNSTVRTNLAVALFQLKRYSEAKTEYQWLVAKQPDLAAAYYFLAITHDQLAEYLDAMANYQQFLRLADPNKSQLEVDKVNLRLPILQKEIKQRKGK